MDAKPGLNYHDGHEIHRLPAQMVIPPISVLRSMDDAMDDAATNRLHASRESQSSTAGREAEDTDASPDDSPGPSNKTDNSPSASHVPRNDSRRSSASSSPTCTLDSTTTSFTPINQPFPHHPPPPPPQHAPSPPFKLSPLSAPTHAHATTSLSTPTYFYTLIRQHTSTLPSPSPSPAPAELFAQRNHAVVLEIEQMLIEFHLQLRGCHVWGDEVALRDLWMRCKGAGRGMRRLAQPGREGGGRGKGRGRWDGVGEGGEESD